MESEKELIQLATAGDDGAFEKLVRNNMRHVYATAFAVVKNHFDADDVAQVSFIKAYRALKKFRGDSTFKTWITRITINQAKDHLRRRNGTVNSVNIGRHPRGTATTPSPSSPRLQHPTKKATRSRNSLAA